VPTPAAVAAAAKPDFKPPPASATAGALPARVYFASGSAALDPNAKESLRSIGNGLIGAPYRIEVTGYVDGRGAAAKNRLLAEQRAKAVRDALVAVGVPADRIQLSPPANIVGDSEHERARRVDIAFAIR